MPTQSRSSSGPDPERMRLTDASVQDIQLELIRRTKFNSFDGERVVALLNRHRKLWTAVMLDRPGLPNHANPGRLMMGSLIKLRDLPDNVWNADQLFALTPTAEAARQLAQAFTDDEGGGMVHVYTERDDPDSALGVGRLEYGLMSVWWD